MTRSMYLVAKYSLAALVFCAPLAAQAVEGWVVDDISLQAGPDPAYPSITELRAGTSVSIQGCISGWTWCDVVVGADRGWVPGTFLEEDYGGQRVVVVDYGPRIGIPVVGFSLAVYWDQHYHNRPFYAQREQWVTKAIQPSQPPRPAQSVARTTQSQRSSTTTQAATGTPQQQQQQMQQQTRSQQQTTKTTQQQSSATQRQTTTARVKTPQRPETAPQPEAGKQPSQVEKRQSAPEQTTVAKAKPRAGEPKPKDELKNPKPKDKQQQQQQQNEGGGTDGGQH
jgi:uncharacterized protein YraI